MLSFASCSTVSFSSIPQWLQQKRTCAPLSYLQYSVKRLGSRVRKQNKQEDIAEGHDWELFEPLTLLVQFRDNESKAVVMKYIFVLGEEDIPGEFSSLSVKHNMCLNQGNQQKHQVWEREIVPLEISEAKGWSQHQYREQQFSKSNICLSNVYSYWRFHQRYGFEIKRFDCQPEYR